MFQDMQIPVMLSTDERVVKTIDELIEDLTPRGCVFTVNQNVNPSGSNYTIRANGIMATLPATIVIPAGTYSGSDVVYASDNNRYYLKLATTTAGQVETIIKGFVDASELVRSTVLYGILYRKDATGIYGQNAFTSLYILKGARTAIDPKDDETYLIAQSIYNSSSPSVSVSADTRIIPTVFLLSGSQIHLPEEI